VAFAAWLLAAVLLVLVGLYLVTGALSVDADTLVARGLTADQATSVRRSLGAFGALSVLVGLAVGFLAPRVRDGDARARRAMVALSIVFTPVAVVATLFSFGGVLVLLPALVLLGCVAGVTRPGLAGWFHGDGPRSVAG
jgi:hypothetical protein